MAGDLETVVQDDIDERFDTIVIGGGQAGLATGHHLAQRGVEFVILDANERIGHAWRTRWDSLRLFTPASHDGLPGLRFPAPGGTFPTKDQMADYLEAYAARFDLPVRTGVRVDGLVKDGDRYVITSGTRRIAAGNVVVATGHHREPSLPAFAPELDAGIVQLHSTEYRGPGQLHAGGVLVVGAGNSGADIGIEVARGHRTWMSGPDTGHIPFRTEWWISRRVVFPMLFFIASHVLTVGNPIGRKVRPKILGKGDPLIRVKPKDLAAAGIERVPRTVGVRDGKPELEDGRVLDVANVIWCTGFRPDFDWIDLPVFGEDGEPEQEHGVVRNSPGLYFVGRDFMHAFTSEVVGGVGRDAGYLAAHLAANGRRVDAASRAPAGSGSA